MHPHGIPSGGDWGLQRDGALFFEGTEGLDIRGCLFERLDGIALMLSGYTRNATIAENEFKLIGDSVIVSWGYTKEEQGIEGVDGTAPLFSDISYYYLFYFLAAFPFI